MLECPHFEALFEPAETLPLEVGLLLDGAETAEALGRHERAADVLVFVVGLALFAVGKEGGGWDEHVADGALEAEGLGEHLDDEGEEDVEDLLVGVGFESSLNEGLDRIVLSELGAENRFCLGFRLRVFSF